MLGADFYETDSEIAYALSTGKVPVGIGENTRIKYRQFDLWVNPQKFFHIISFSHFSICRECIIDKNAQIGKNVVIENSEVSFSQNAYQQCILISFISNFIQ